MNASIQRRYLLALGASLPLGACAGGPSPSDTVQRVASDAVVIAVGLRGAVAQLKVLGTLPAPTLDAADKYVAAIQEVASALAGASSDSAKPLVDRLASYAEALGATLLAQGAVPLPPAVSAAVQAALVLVPVLQVAVGLAVNRAAPSAAEASKARTVLKS